MRKNFVIGTLVGVIIGLLVGGGGVYASKNLSYSNEIKKIPSSYGPTGTVSVFDDADNKCYVLRRNSGDASYGSISCVKG